jgi:tRNA U34 5-carboxymethylaminomethyl modifying GTPase MnmE/TrmE
VSFTKKLCLTQERVIPTASDAGQIDRAVALITQAKKPIIYSGGGSVIGNASELLAQDLYHAAQDLGSITGEFSSDDLLGEIFSSFCIGK